MKYRTQLLCIVIALMMMLSMVAVTPASASDSEESFIISQGDQCIAVEPLSGDETVEEFYDYRHRHHDRDDPRWGRYYSSEGTVEYQEDDTSILILYEGPDGISLVSVHDMLHRNQEEGTHGGSVTFYIDGLPDEYDWAVIDDDYAIEYDDLNQDNIYDFDSTPAMLSWVWQTGRTDGMALRGLERSDDLELTIEPGFNEDSYHRYGDQRRDGPNDRPDKGERYNGTIDDWEVLSFTDGSYDRIPLDSLDEEVTISYGFCDGAEQLDASLSASTSLTAANESVSFTVDHEDEDSIDTYQWDVDGDGSVDLETRDPSIEFTYEDAGSYTPTVYMETDNGATYTATTDMFVADEGDPILSVHDHDTMLFADSHDPDDDGPYSYQFALSEAVASAITSDHNDLQLYANENGEWSPLETDIDADVDESEDSVLLSAETDATQVAVGTQSHIPVGLLPDQDEYSDLLTIDQSDGDEFDRVIEIEGDISLESAGTVDTTDNETMQNAVSEWFPAAGQYELSHVTPTEGAAEQLHITDIDVEPDPATAGESIVVSVTVENTRLGTVQFDAEPTINGDSIGTTSVSVAGEETRTLTFPTTIDEPGEHTFEIAGETTTIVVEEDPSSQLTDTLSGASGGWQLPVFLIFSLGVIGVVSAVLIRRSSLS